MALLKDKNAWRLGLDPRDPDAMDPLTLEEQQELEDAMAAEHEATMEMNSYSEQGW